MSGDVRQKQAPSVGSILRADYFAMLAVVAPVALWGVCGATLMGWVLRSSPRAGTVFLVAAVVVTVVCLPLALMRVRRVQALFREGTVTRGTITSLWLEGDRGRVEFRFQGRDGGAVTTGQALHRSPRAEALEVGQEVDVVFDPANPESALIADLFG